MPGPVPNAVAASRPAADPKVPARRRSRAAPGRPAIARHPAHRDQARCPRMSVAALERVAPPAGSLHVHGRRFEHVSGRIARGWSPCLSATVAMFRGVCLDQPLQQPGSLPWENGQRQECRRCSVRACESACVADARKAPTTDGACSGTAQPVHCAEGAQGHPRSCMERRLARLRGLECPTARWNAWRWTRSSGREHPRSRKLRASWHLGSKASAAPPAVSSTGRAFACLGRPEG